MIKRRTMAVLGLATVLAGGAGVSMAYADETGPATTVKAVPGAKPDFAEVKPGTLVPLGKVAGAVGGDTTTVDSGEVSLHKAPGAKPDLSTAVPGTAVPLGPVSIVGSSGTTDAR